MYDSIIVGAGIAGAVTARKLADHGQKILIIEKRNHIGGNCYDYVDENGILVHKYGPHIFHTNSNEVYKYLSKFTKWYDYHHEVLAFVGGQYIPIPFNLNTLEMVFSSDKATKLQKKLVEKYGYDKRVTIMDMLHDCDKEIQEIAEFVYNNIFLKYTVKQWGQTPEQIDKSVMSRVPVLISKDNGYFQDKYQGMPLHGYTKLFENMLDHDNIEIRCFCDAKDFLQFNEDEIYFEGTAFHGNVVYTGAIDELFGLEYGRLPYRTLEFQFEELKMKSYQPAAVVNYTVSEKFTRITEFKKLTGQKSENTTIVREYSKAYTGEKNEIPYYAIINKDNNDLYERYIKIAQRFKNLYLLGRLAEYKYYNIDAITLEALRLSENKLVY